jgi:hypothetical protein
VQADWRSSHMVQIEALLRVMHLDLRRRHASQGRDDRFARVRLPAMLSAILYDLRSEIKNYEQRERCYSGCYRTGRLGEGANQEF